MRKQLSTPVIVTVVSLLVLLLAFVGWKLFSPPAPDAGSETTLNAAQKRKLAREGGD